ncbi:MAG TPA: DoxX family protein, partial [Acidimicrobiales bacterium]|nr:DoxX family protein [Acidimicrobiales bacterium]
ITNHLKNGFFIFRPGEGYEYVMTLAVMGGAIGTLGPGNWSIDAHVQALSKLLGWPGFAIAVGGGILGCALLLATSWRPAKPSEA